MCNPLIAAATVAGVVLAPKIMDSLMPKAPQAPAPIETPQQEAPPTPAVAPTPAPVQQQGSTSTTVIQQAPTEQAKPVQDARQRELRQRQLRAQKSSTLVTGGAGITTPATTGVKTLLGA